MPLTRRDLIRSVPLAAFAARFSSPFAHADEGMIVRVRQPQNLETPLSELPGVTTEKFYVRNHFAIPTMDPKSFRLTVVGHVANKLELSLDDLKKMEEVSRENVLECAGNGRVFLVPAVRGAQWAHGAAGTAKWTGVPIGAILERAKVKPGAVDVVLIGADSGAIGDPPSPGVIHFDRAIPMSKAKKDESILAWNMNDAPLTASHGAPLRALIGGWYGMASVKWLSRIVVTDRPHAGYWQTTDYSIWDRSGPTPQLVPVTAMEAKAVITSLGPDAVLALGKKETIRGLAWAGEQAVKTIEISTDGGKTWSPASHPAGKPFAWTAWSAEITPSRKGTLSLVARCTDDKGRTQPTTRNSDRRTYMINHLVPVDVNVK